MLALVTDAVPSGVGFETPAAPAAADSASGESGDSAAENPIPAILATDSTTDSMLVLPVDSAAVPRRSRVVYVKTDLDAPVDFSATDSMLIIRRDSAFMYGDGVVKYGDIQLDAAEIQMDLKDNTVYAVGRQDSDQLVGKPVFTESGTEYEAKTMRYNFKTEKGYISNVVTQQGEGYLTGGTTKKSNENDFYISNGR